MTDKTRKELEEQAEKHWTVEPLVGQRVKYTPTPPTGEPPKDQKQGGRVERPKRGRKADA